VEFHSMLYDVAYLEEMHKNRQTWRKVAYLTFNNLPY
jgi:hypothetical protein